MRHFESQVMAADIARKARNMTLRLIKHEQIHYVSVEDVLELLRTIPNKETRESLMNYLLYRVTDQPSAIREI